MTNPLTVGKEKLINVATGSIAEDEIQRGIKKVEEVGEKELQKFLVERLSHKEVDVYDRISRCRS